jgi:drug/metabolite transporter (DMT)-like permease
MSSKTSPLLAYSVLIAAQLAVGSAAVLARSGLSAGLEPVSLAAWRLTLASAVLLVIAGFRQRQRDAKDEDDLRDRSGKQKLLLVVAGVLLGLHFAFWFASLQIVSVARSTLLVATGPLWTGLAERFLLKRTTPVTFWLGLGFAGIGAYFVMTKGGASTMAGNLHGSPLLGDALATLGAIAIAGYLLIAKELQVRLGAIRLVTSTYSFAAISLWPLALLTATVASILPHSSAAWLSVLGMALIPQLIGHTAFNWSLKHFSAGAVGAATLLEPAFAAGLAWWFFGEAVTGMQGVGGVVLLVGVGLALWRQG